MKTLLFFCMLLATSAFGQLPSFTGANVKTYFDTASSATIDTFAVHASQNYTNAWTARFSFAGKQIYLTELGLVPTPEKSYVIWGLGQVSIAKANGVTVDFSGFSFTSDGDNSGSVSKIDTKIHTDWVTIPVMPYIVLASFWITKDIKK